jgi:hypothetical protein
LQLSIHLEFYTIVCARLSIRFVSIATRFHPQRHVVCAAKDTDQNKCDIPSCTVPPSRGNLLANKKGASIS